MVVVLLIKSDFVKFRSFAEEIVGAKSIAHTKLNQMMYHTRGQTF
jgi:hypothetical protein